MPSVTIMYHRWSGTNGAFDSGKPVKHYVPGALWQRKVSRPIQTGWIALSERRPTEADADERGRVLVKFSNGNTIDFEWTASLFGREENNCRAIGWLSIPRFQEAADKDTKAFDKFFKDSDFSLPATRRHTKEAWDAALAYARKEAQS